MLGFEVILVEKNWCVKVSNLSLLNRLSVSNDLRYDAVR